MCVLWCILCGHQGSNFLTKHTKLNPHTKPIHVCCVLYTYHMFHFEICLNTI